MQKQKHAISCDMCLDEDDEIVVMYSFCVCVQDSIGFGKVNSSYYFKYFIRITKCFTNSHLHRVVSTYIISEKFICLQPNIFKKIHTLLNIPSFPVTLANN